MLWVKRIVTMLIGGVALTVGWLLWQGGRGVGRNQVRIMLRRPPAQVFPWVTEPEKLTRWIGGLVESTPLTRDGLRVGARSREVMVLGRERYEMESIITEVVPDRLLAARITNAGFDVNARYELEHLAGGTMLTYTSIAYYKHPIAKVMAPLVTRDAQKKLEADFARLKALVEVAN